MKNTVQQISIIGSGNVAWHLAVNFINIGVKVSHIAGRNVKHVDLLCKKTAATHAKSISDLPKHQLVIICTPDNSIATICESIDSSCPVAYTSGSIDIESLPHREHLGVFYPLQTFSKHIELDLNQVPFFIESTNEVFTQDLFILASKITDTVTLANSKERSELHLAAVFVNNFTNHIIHQAQQYAESKSIDFNHLIPLLKETVHKLDLDSAFNTQTGPARRGDDVIIQKHVERLDNNAKELYQLLSKSIKETYHDQL
ncbi:MAG: DUF2520 domain-containing protein [Crocinitomicaceae bacterium]|nr:DUF2520 domain-containing protein [Crocinitomicaceae bacterium]MDG1775967.1 DUF2520 domain-containing protein [Crocinitomicaceae bacterium]